MPLLDLSGEKEVTIDGDSYTLRRYVSWLAREKASMSKGMVFYVSRRDMENGMANMSPDALIPMSADSTDDTKMLRLETWLIRWSHRESDGTPVRITRSALERLPRSHVRFLLSEIAELERDQDGPKENSPLDGESNV